MNERPIIRSADDVKVKVIYTEGYQQRFTMALLKQWQRPEERERWRRMQLEQEEVTT